jgi:type IV pilus assembly protein PilE
MKRSKGFTLIELMIVVAIIAIVASIAVPSYSEYIMRSRRTEAKAALQQAAIWLEKAQTASGVYPVALPTSLSGVPSGLYTITIAFAAGVYTLTATPTGAQATDKCGAFTLDAVGARNVVGATSPMDRTQCWQR